MKSGNKYNPVIIIEFTKARRDSIVPHKISMRCCLPHRLSKSPLMLIDQKTTVRIIAGLLVPFDQNYS
jgi:hypothetical protein